MTYELEYKDPPKAKAGTLTSTIQQMHVGQSFLIPNDDIKDVKKTQAAVHTIAANLEGVKMKTRTEDEGLRVYRIPHEPEPRSEIVEDTELDELPIPKNEKLDNLRTLMNLASSGVKAGEIYGEEPVAGIPVTEDWRFTKKPTHYPDNGNAYREQVLYPAGKRFRNVRVDIDNQDEIIPE